MTMGRPPLIDDKTFIQVWNENNGDVSKVSQKLGIKYNTVWVRGNRLLKKQGINPNTKTDFTLRYEDLKR